MLTCLIVLRRRSSTTRRARAGAGGAGSGRVVCCASSRLLRLFLSAALLHPPLRLFFSYSGGSRGAAEGKGRSRRGRGRARGHRCAWGHRPAHLFRPIGPARLAADANGPAGGVVRRLGKATGAHLPASAPRISSSSHSSTNPGRLFRGGFEDVGREGRGGGLLGRVLLVRRVVVRASEGVSRV